ncbi:hypothetical protein Dsin_020811 [Dipteronia sinensis]|uniref:Zinc knuckle CX2CX4HX4C domain-containing protein n=1 Tax=Dipteronia sinensis TaxID=43782 RepID=A0AAE0AA65_9ROSI|nr:hypothetical protein Dsin_020811 [Dipteronia sinensis]
MVSDDISQLCASLSLIEREGPVRKLGENLKVAAIQRLSFKDLNDRSGVLLGAPWTFDNVLLMLEEPVGKGSIEKMAFNMCDFWVQIYQVPLMCSSREIRWFLREMIRVVLDVDGGLAGDGVGKFLRVRVRIDITKPLRRCLRVDILGDRVETIMLLRYERLPHFCFKYGKIGHTMNECQSEDQIPVVDGVDKHLFGAWMKASSVLRKIYLRNFRGLSKINDHNNTSCSKVDTDS